MSTHGIEYLGPVAVGRSIPVYRESLSAAATLQKTVLLEADSCLISLWVSSLSSGSLSVEVSTITEVGREFPIITFPAVTGPTSNLLLKKASLAMSRVVVRVIATGVCSFDVDLRGIGAGEASTKIVGSSNAVAVKYAATSTPGIVIPSTLSDRNGLVLKNNGPTGILYMGFSLAEATLATGYPLAVGESLALDIAAGVNIYGVSSGGTLDIRTMQAFG